MENTLRDRPICSEALSRGRVQELRNLHATATGELAAEMASLLRCPVEVELSEAAQSPYGRFLDRLDSVTCVHLLRATPPGDALLLEIELSIVYPMIDRLLGGGSEDEPPPRRALGDIELPLAARIVRVVGQWISLVWRETADLTLETVQTESNPRRMRVLPTDEWGVTIELLLTVGSRRGKLRLCIPCRTIRMLDDRRAGKQELAALPSDRSADGAGDRETNASVDVSVALTTTSITASELSSLQVGDVLATETKVGSPVIVSLCGEPKYLASLGVCRGRKAVCIDGAGRWRASSLPRMIFQTTVRGRFGGRFIKAVRYSAFSAAGGESA